MAPGFSRCMYCGDSEGSAVDHFEPVAENPLRAFNWMNHLLACSRCNSDYKREQFPRDPQGAPLLLDPTCDDPAEHLHLILAAGWYKGETERGKRTIEVLGLNREVLVKGRRNAYSLTAYCLIARAAVTANGGVQDDSVFRRMIWEQPMADVVVAMLAQAILPGAEDIFADEPEVLRLLCDPALRSLLLAPEERSDPAGAAAE